VPPSHLCTPVSVDGGTIKNTGGKLLCYQVRLSREQPRHAPRIGVHVATAFGSTQVDTRKVVEICVPAH